MNNSFLSCDWGTSSFRLKLADVATGTIHATVKTSQGIQEVYNSWAESAQKQERETFYYRYLKEQIALLAEKTGKNLEGIPLILSGMASSSIGIKELPYASVPVSLEQSDLRLDISERTEYFPHKVILISGICSDHDVMRGEETQLFGLASRYNIENGVCILPGTHSKHIAIQNSIIVRFSTFLTGELFDLLSTKSILRNSVRSDAPFHAEAFKSGLQQAQQGNLLSKLFKIRADEVLHKTDPVENYNFLSGLIIGTELAGLEKHRLGQIILAGEHTLQRLYSEALHFIGFDHLSVTSTENLAVEGQRYLLNKL